MTHGHDGGTTVGVGYRAEGNKGEKKWDNCNSRINEIYFKKKKTNVSHV